MHLAIKIDAKLLYYMCDFSGEEMKEAQDLEDRFGCNLVIFLLCGLNITCWNISKFHFKSDEQNLKAIAHQHPN